MGGQVVLTYEVPKDTASETFGALAHNGVTNDGRALCGSRSHQMSINGIQIGPQNNDQKIQSATWLEFEYLPNGDPDVLVQRNYPAGGAPSPPIPVYQIRINSTSMDDWGEHIMELEFWFDDYGSAPANARRWLINA